MKLLFALATMLFAANDSTFLLWKVADLQQYEAMLRARVGPDHTANERLPDLDGHGVFVVHRDGTGLAEAHDTVTHVIYVISGAANVVVGGTMVDERRLAPEQLRASSITGGDTTRIAAGDVLYIAKVPHWFKVDPGEHVTYLMINLEAP
jgi:mannose-6-phosphate isomerase-like protein (cupin superfamily)